MKVNLKSQVVVWTWSTRCLKWLARCLKYDKQYVWIHDLQDVWIHKSVSGMLKWNLWCAKKIQKWLNDCYKWLFCIIVKVYDLCKYDERCKKKCWNCSDKMFKNDHGRFNEERVLVHCYVQKCLEMKYLKVSGIEHF